MALSTVRAFVQVLSKIATAPLVNRLKFTINTLFMVINHSNVVECSIMILVATISHTHHYFSINYTLIHSVLLVHSKDNGLICYFAIISPTPPLATLCDRMDVQNSKRYPTYGLYTLFTFSHLTLVLNAR